MKNVHEVLTQKEADRDRILAEIDALRTAIPLLEDEQNTAEERTDHHPNVDSREVSDTSSRPASGGGWRDKWKMASR
jgi:hypothetical protein